MDRLIELAQERSKLVSRLVEVEDLIIKELNLSPYRSAVVKKPEPSTEPSTVEKPVLPAVTPVVEKKVAPVQPEIPQEEEFEDGDFEEEEVDLEETEEEETGRKRISLKSIVKDYIAQCNGVALKDVVAYVDGLKAKGLYHSNAKSISAVVSQATNQLQADKEVERRVVEIPPEGKRVGQYYVIK